MKMSSLKTFTNIGCDRCDCQIYVYTEVGKVTFKSNGDKALNDDFP